MKWLKADQDEMDNCILCGEPFEIGVSGNELGFCEECQSKPDFPYDLDAYYKDYDDNKVAFKGFDTMDRGILEPYKKKNVKSEQENIKPCEHCGEPTSFIKEKYDPAEGQNCSECGDWICDKCADWKNSGTEEHSDVVCKKCTEKGVKAAEEPVNFGDLKVGEKFNATYVGERQEAVLEKVNDHVGIYVEPSKAGLLGQRQLLYTDAKVYRVASVEGGAKHGDISRGVDFRGDYALFIEEKHFKKDGWSLDINIGPEATFFRIIENGEEQTSHGWARGKKVEQWG